MLTTMTKIVYKALRADHNQISRFGSGRMIKPVASRIFDSAIMDLVDLEHKEFSLLTHEADKDWKIIWEVKSSLTKDQYTQK